MHALARLSMAAILLAACRHGNSQSLIDGNREDLIKAAPELSALEFAPDQGPLELLLRETGQRLENTIAKFVNVSIAEEVHQMRFDAAHLMWIDRRDEFRYLVRTNPVSESRTKTKSEDALLGAKSPFVLTAGFESMLGDLLPENQSQSRFRYLGRIQEAGVRSSVIAFAEREGARQGLVWIDDAAKRIIRVRTDVLKHPPEEKFESFTRDVRFVPVSFPALAATLWLPSRATVHIRFAAGEAHNVHRFSDYREDQREQEAGQAAPPAGMEDDAIEVLLQGVAALTAGKPGDAIAPLLDAERRLPERVEPGYYLGLASYGKHDLEQAETKFRQTLKRSPNLAVAHNELAAVLFQRGNRAAAVAELEEALRLEPGNTKMRANLDQALREPGAKTGNAAPPLPGAPGDVTIKVNVQQVLVPVVVTDKQGHHVTGLTKADFKVFEDGVQQNITAFTNERADVSNPAVPGTDANQPGAHTAAQLPKPLAAHRAYVICLDMMHGSFGNFVYIREALHKLFQQEQVGDSQYVVISLGKTLQIVQNTTTDPAKVLETLDGANFQNSFQQSSSQFEISRFESDLQGVRSACDAGDPSCSIRKQMLPPQARELAEHERFRTTDFTAQLRSVVEQSVHGGGRRTLILISDGFLLAPGEISYGLLEAYFPEFHSTQAIERMQDVLEPIFKLAVKGNVPIYTIDSRGLYTLPSFDVSRSVNSSAATRVDRAVNERAAHEGQTLLEIAAATGGTAFQNSNDMLAGLKRAFADGREYYMLAYVPSNETQDGKFRKIEVQVRDRKAVVSAKRGYWANGRTEEPNNR